MVSALRSGSAARSNAAGGKKDSLKCQSYRYSHFIKEGRFRLDIEKKFFPMRVVKHWPRLPREAVAAPSLAGFKARLDGALSTLVWWEMSLLMAGGLEPDDL